jgi:hypothetical protein
VLPAIGWNFNKGGKFLPTNQQISNMENSEQLARVISEAVTNAIRRASTGTAGTVHANEQNNEVFYLFHRFTTFIIQIEAQGLFAYLNFVFRDRSLFMAGGGTEEKCFSWQKFC